MRYKLLAGSAATGGILGVFDPGGVEPQSLHAFRRVAGDTPQVQVPAEPAPAGRSPVLALLAGEVFNLGVLASELELPPSAEAEAVLEAGYTHWSQGLLERLRGSFALVVVDGETGDALIAADQTGAHSMFFRADGARLWFASELRLLLKLLPVRPSPNPVALVHWLVAGSSRPAGHTLYEGVFELAGGEQLELSGESWTRSRYWTLRYEPPLPLTAPEATDLLWASFTRAVGTRLSPGQLTGIVMSSGVDSSAVAAAAADAAPASGSSLHGYSAVFPGHPEPNVDEAERIDLLVIALGLATTQVRFEPGGAFALSVEWLAAWELPLLGPGYLLERPLAELAAADGVVGLLDGQRGDEAFGLSAYWLADLLRRGRLVASLAAARRLPGEESESWRASFAAWRSYALHGAAPIGLQRAIRRRRSPYRYAPGHLTDESARLLVETDAIWDWKQRRGVPAWWAEKAQLLVDDRQADGIGGYLRQRAALAGLKARPPLFDVDLIELSLRIPPPLEFDRVLDRPLIRRAMAGRVPDSLWQSTWKSNLAPFYFDGMVGADLEPIRRLLGTSSPEIGAYAKPDAVRELVDNPPRADATARGRWVADVWRLATAECWLRAQTDSGFVEELRARRLPQPRWAVHRTSL